MFEILWFIIKIENTKSKVFQIWDCRILSLSGVLMDALCQFIKQENYLRFFIQSGIKNWNHSL